MDINKLGSPFIKNGKVSSNDENIKKCSQEIFIKSSGSDNGLVENYINSISDFENISEFISKNGDKINDGLSKYKHNDSQFSFYKNDSEIKGEYITPDGVDVDEALEDFIEAYPALSSTVSSLQASSSGTINGQIDETTLQGGTGDCWLLTAINALNSSDLGKEIISNAITVNDDGSATVTFAGVGVSYTISAEEIAKYDTDDNLDDSYSNGDNDMLVLELAVEKLYEDINSGKVTLNTDNEDIAYAGEGGGIDDGGLPLQMIYYLTGIESSEYYNENISKSLSSNEIYSILSNAYENSDSTVLTFGIYYGVHTAKLTDGSTYTLDVGTGGHALAITEVTEDTVTFVNPWDSSVSYTMSWDEFVKLGVGYVSSTDLSSLVSDAGEDSDTEVDDEDDSVVVDDADIDNSSDEDDNSSDSSFDDSEFIPDDFITRPFGDFGKKGGHGSINRGHGKSDNFFDNFNRGKNNGFNNGFDNVKRIRPKI